jgi:hypothetical protein
VRKKGRFANSEMSKPATGFAQSHLRTVPVAAGEGSRDPGGECRYSDWMTYYGVTGFGAR